MHAQLCQCCVNEYSTDCRSLEASVNKAYESILILEERIQWVACFTQIMWSCHINCRTYHIKLNLIGLNSQTDFSHYSGKWHILLSQSHFCDERFVFLIIHAENLPVMFQGESDQINLYSPLYQCLTFFLVVLDYFEQGWKSCDKKVMLIIGKLIFAGEK